MGVADTYRDALRGLAHWDEWLLDHSGLPGPRGNIELAQVVADLGGRDLFHGYLSWTPERAPVGSREEFLAFCGTVGLGRLLADGDVDVLPALRRQASDPRWRVREGVAMALQRLGDADMPHLLREMRRWAAGEPLEQRAAAAALCEPRLLRKPPEARAVLRILDDITGSVERSTLRSGEAFGALRKGLGYCWSVAVAALPEDGKPLLGRWAASADPDIRWIVKENLKKARLERVDATWVAAVRRRLDGAEGRLAPRRRPTGRPSRRGGS